MNKYSGSNFDDFLKEEGIFEEVSTLTRQRLETLQAEDKPGTINRFLQWCQQTLNYLRPPVLVPVGVGLLVCIIVYGSDFFGNRDQVELPEFVESGGKEANIFGESERGGGENANTREKHSPLVSVSNKVESGGTVESISTNKFESAGTENANTFKELQFLAQQGQAEAQFLLGEMYYQGERVSRNYVEAHIWWSLAAKQGFDKASEKRDMVAQLMTADQLTKAERWAREWKRGENKPK